jgi:hypothetical protein
MNETVYNCRVVVTDLTLGKKSWLLTHPLKLYVHVRLLSPAQEK